MYIHNQKSNDQIKHHSNNIIELNIAIVPSLHCQQYNLVQWCYVNVIPGTSYAVSSI